MSVELLDDILSCPNLPSLPAVALRVIELTRNPNVSMKELATTIQNDQGLASKVLRTVNSSFFGLRQRCSTINQALVMLGLSAVKSLALGFSLVSCVHADGDDGFDYVAYWRRGLVTAVAAKSFARAVGHLKQDEAFLGGLLQDIGMMAMYRALEGRYLLILERTGADHRQLVREELAECQLQHPDVGAMLCQRWKLPDELVVPVKYHERPTAGPQEHADLIRFVAIGNIAHDVLSDDHPSEALSRLYARAAQWWQIPETMVDERLQEITVAAREMASLFRLDTGPFASAEQVLRAADTQLQEQAIREAESNRNSNPDSTIVAGGADRDPVTGLIGPIGFADAARRAFEEAKGSGEPLTAVHVGMAGLARADAPPPAGEHGLLRVATLLRKNFEPLGAVLSRMGDDAFVSLIPSSSTSEACKAAREFVADLDRSSAAWPAHDGAGISTSIGLATMDKANGAAFVRVQQLLGAAARSHEAAKAAGTNYVRVFIPRRAAA